MLLQHLAVARAVLLQQQGRALDIGEDQRDGAGSCSGTVLMIRQSERRYKATEVSDALQRALGPPSHR
jgi:hypothetical protein